MMDSMVARWNAMLQMQYLSNSLQDYLQAVLNFCLFVLFFSLFKRFALGYLGRLAKQTATDFDDFVISLLAGIGLPVFVITAFYFVSLPLNLSATLRICIQYLTVIVITIRTVLLIQKIVQYGIGKFYRRNIKGPNSAAEAMINSISGMINIIIWILGLVFILDNMGINVSALIAGIGIGGVAVALASQAILGDAFSAVTIFFDKPF
ncbi:MAG: mechanosensitive ion channel, partial [Candidatus Omnitrophica bacterium]|nr:mechanosensitive ion channel [Candidatus Omnitrophota bacterium]